MLEIEECGEANKVATALKSGDVNLLNQKVNPAAVDFHSLSLAELSGAKDLGELVPVLVH